MFTKIPQPCRTTSTYLAEGGESVAGLGRRGGRSQGPPVSQMQGFGERFSKSSFIHYLAGKEARSHSDLLGNHELKAWKQSKELSDIALDFCAGEQKRCARNTGSIRGKASMLIHCAALQMLVIS
jgi:hypothetical protein